MSRAIRGTVEDVGRAIARERGCRPSEAMALLDDWIAAARPVGGDPDARQVRLRQKGEIDLTATLDDAGEVEHVSLRLGAGARTGKAAKRRHQARGREKMDERRVWRDERPDRVQIALRLPADLAAAVNARVAADGGNRHELLVDLIRAGLDADAITSAVRRRVRDALSAAGLI